MTGERYGWVVVAAAFTLMLVGFAAAYSFAAFCIVLLGRQKIEIVHRGQ